MPPDAGNAHGNLLRRVSERGVQGRVQAERRALRAQASRPTATSITTPWMTRCQMGSTWWMLKPLTMKARKQRAQHGPPHRTLPAGD